MSEQLPKAILFDLDDTILAFSAGADPSWELICRRFAPGLAGQTAEVLAEAIRTARAEFWADPGRHRRGRLHPGQARREIVGAALSALGVPAGELVGEIAEAYIVERDQMIQPFPGALETLRRLRERGVRMAVITSGSAREQRGKIERFGLEPLFDCILIEGETGIGKPDERVYLGALERLGVRADETWMVGDNLEWDVGAPQELGIRGIWHDFEHRGLPAGSPIRPDRIIRSLVELLDET
jgi:putative hydrolase of the HAD superfamily